MRGILFPAVALLVCVATASPSRAALGGDVTSVLRDHALLGAADAVTQGPGYELHEAFTADGIRLRQYVNLSSGTVFAATWQGPRLPHMAALLGSFTPRYAVAAAAHHGGHHALSIAADDFAFTLLKLPRGWLGRAVLPGTLPAGMDGHEIR